MMTIPRWTSPKEQTRAPGGTPGESQTTEPRRLLRSSSDRVLAGIAGGLGRYFGIDPVIFRIGFALSIFFGGLGALAYLLLAVFVPTDGDPDRAQRVGGRLRALGVWRALGLVAIGVLMLAGLFILAGGAAFVVALGWGVPVAIVIVNLRNRRSQVRILSGAFLTSWSLPANGQRTRGNGRIARRRRYRPPRVSRLTGPSRNYRAEPNRGAVSKRRGSGDYRAER